jgi:hypothetical protein
MRNRHRNLLHSANFLRTSAQPRLVSAHNISEFYQLYADFA